MLLRLSTAVEARRRWSASGHCLSGSELAHPNPRGAFEPSGILDLGSRANLVAHALSGSPDSAPRSGSSGWRGTICPTSIRCRVGKVARTTVGKQNWRWHARRAKQQNANASSSQLVSPSWNSDVSAQARGVAFPHPFASVTRHKDVCDCARQRGGVGQLR